MKYILLMQFPLAAWKTDAMGLWPPDDVKRQLAFLRDWTQKLTESGELVGSQGLGSRATTGSMPCARTCTRWRAIAGSRSRTTSRRRVVRRTCPSARTSRPGRRASARSDHSAASRAATSSAAVA